jgi:hypothetical protein
MFVSLANGVKSRVENLSSIFDRDLSDQTTPAFLGCQFSILFPSREGEDFETRIDPGEKATL